MISFKVIRNYFIIFLEIIRRKQASKTNETFSCKINSINPIQKYPHIIKLSACILNMFVLMHLCPMNLLNSLGTSSKPKLSKQITSLFFTYKAIQFVPTSAYSSRCIINALFFIVLDKLSLE